MAECKHMRHPRRRSLADARPQYVKGIGCLGINPREHHERLEAQTAALLPQFFRVGRKGGSRGDDWHLTCAILVRRAPGHIIVAGRFDSS